MSMDTAIAQGPLLSDREFFSEHLDLEREELAAVALAAKAGDYPAARAAFARYIREFLRPDVFFTIPYEIPENVYTLPGESEEEAAERICTNHLISCGVSCEFGERVDWFANPTYNGYKEWTWQLSRHNEWKLLAHVYRRAPREEYAAQCARLFTSWVRQAVFPGDVHGNETLCWRTIECGIRMGANWPYVLHTFYNTPAFTDDVLVDWFKSVCEHGIRLRRNHWRSNWLIMEMNGLAQIAILFPFFRQAKSWLDFAFSTLDKELEKQIYADGFQYELSTGYHDVVINNYQRMIQVAMAYGVEIPASFLPALERATAVNVKLMMPDGRLPDLNDGCRRLAATHLEPKMALFPGNRQFQWVLSGGKEGERPDYTSVALPDSGFLVMRTGWEKDAVWGLLDAAPFGRAHQHEDKLSLLVYAGEKLLLTEGGNYAYDDSEMRRYVLSTRSHNTVRVDGQDQNRLQGYRWEEGDIHRPSGMKWSVGTDVDWAEGAYDEGYGPDGSVQAAHTRAVYLLKRPGGGLAPFFLVVDRLESAGERLWETLWHLDVPSLELGEDRAKAEQITVLSTGGKAGVEAVRGREAPQWQGWAACGQTQGDYYPVYTLTHWDQGQSLRRATVLYPRGDCPIAKVEAGGVVSDTDVLLHLADGGRLELDETGLR